MSRTQLYTKKELRLLAGISESTFSKYLNNMYFTELSAIGYVKEQKILTSEQYKFLVEKLVIVE
jgi:hypothetical protein